MKMKFIRELRLLIGKKPFEAETAEEMRLHLELHAERNVATGMTNVEAHYAALRQFGGVEQIKEQCRDQRGWTWWVDLLRDVKFAARGLLRAPGFSFGVIATLTLGIGFSASVFCFVDLVARAPLRLPQPDRLVRVWSSADGARSQAPAAAWPLYEMLAERNSTFTDVGAMAITGFTYMGDDAPMSIGGTRVTGSLVSTLGAPLLRGRLFTPQEEAPGGPPVVLLAPWFWRQALGAREDVIGLSIVLNGVPHEVVGVIGDEIALVDAGNAVLLPRPFELPGVTAAAAQRGAFTVQVTARLQPGLTLAQANADLQNVVSAYRERFPENAGVERKVYLRSYAEELTGNARPAAWCLMAAAGCVLLIAMSNAASLCVARAVHRKHDAAVRLALGGTSARVARVWVGEIALLVAGSAVFALLFVRWTLPIIDQLARPFLPQLPALQFGPSSWIAVGGAAAGALVVLSLVPLLQVARTSASGALTANRTMTGGARVQSGLVALQVAVTSSLLMAAAVLLVSYRTLHETSPGFDPTGMTTGFVNLPAAQYPTAERQVAFFEDVVQRIRGADASFEVALVATMPLTRELRGTEFAVAGQPAPPENRRPTAISRDVSDDYFSVMRVPLREGRYFQIEDRSAGRSVGIVNESFARRLFGSVSAVGQVLVSGPSGQNRVEIIGVVGDVRSNGLAAGPTDEIYRPLRGGSQVALAVRSTREAAYVQAAITRALKVVDPYRALAVFQTSEQFLSRSSSSQRLVAWATGVFAVAAIALAAVGLYGLVACWVGQRRREFGVRLALGADGGDIQRMMLGQAMKLVGVGLAAGGIVYLAGSGIVRRTVFGVSALDPATIGVAAGSLFVIALVACYLPARRAAKIDPVVALRCE